MNPDEKVVLPPALTRGASQRPPRVVVPPPGNVQEAMRQRDQYADQARALAALLGEVMQNIHAEAQHPGQWERCSHPFCLAVRMKGVAIGYPGMG